MPESWGISPEEWAAMEKAQGLPPSGNTVTSWKNHLSFTSVIRPLVILAWNVQSRVSGILDGIPKKKRIILAGLGLTIATGAAWGVYLLSKNKPIEPVIEPIVPITSVPADTSSTWAPETFPGISKPEWPKKEWDKQSVSSSENSSRSLPWKSAEKPLPPAPTIYFDGSEASKQAFREAVERMNASNPPKK